jgi:hypothetical protein
MSRHDNAMRGPEAAKDRSANKEQHRNPNSLFYALNPLWQARLERLPR